MANEAPPAAPPPSSATSAAKPISLAQLKQELTTPPAARPPEPPQPKTEAKPAPVAAPEPPKNQDAPGARPQQTLKEKMRERVMESKKETTPEVKKEAPEAKPAEAPTKPKESAPEPEVPDEHLRVLPHDKPDTARRISKFLANEKKYKEEVAAARAELDAAKKLAPTPANAEEVAKLKADYEAAQNDLLRYRRRYDIENDKDFASKYREPVKQAETTIEETLKRAGIGDPTLDVIRKEGGFANFSRSNRTFTVHEPDPENEGKTRPVQRTAAQLARSWLDSIAVSDSEFIRAAVGKQQLLQAEEQGAIKAAQDDAKTYFETQTKAQREAAEKAQATQAEMAQKYEKWATETEGSLEYLKDREVPQNATPDQKKEVEDYNEFNKQLRSRLRSHPNNVEEYTQLKLDAVEAHHLRRTMSQKDAEIARLKEQLEKTQKAVRTTPKGGSILTGPKDAPKPKENANPTDFKTALRQRVLGNQQSALDE